MTAAPAICTRHDACVSETGRVAVLLACLAVVAGAASWRVVGDGGDGTIAGVRCIFVVTTNDGSGFQEVPCNDRANDDLGQPLSNLYCDPALRIPAPGDDLSRCPGVRRP